jgi:hypothetical protein
LAKDQRETTHHHLDIGVCFGGGGRQDNTATTNERVGRGVIIISGSMFSGAMTMATLNSQCNQLSSFDRQWQQWWRGSKTQLRGLYTHQKTKEILEGQSDDIDWHALLVQCMSCPCLDFWWHSWQAGAESVVGQLYSIQYKSVFGAPDKVRRCMCEEARPSRLDFQRKEVKIHHIIALTQDCWS